MLTCKKAAELLLDFLENNLGPEESGDMRSHLQACSLCAQFVESYQKTSVVCRRVLREKVPAASGEGSQRLLDFLRRECSKSGK